MEIARWTNVGSIESKSYVCGHCGEKIVSNVGCSLQRKISGKLHNIGIIIICHFCMKPTYIEERVQFPGVAFGNFVKNIPDKIIEELYEEARRATSASCFTCSVLACRKLLMHIGVSLGAEENKKFAYYVDYLFDNHYLPIGAKDWVNHIRKKGNEANHEIILMNSKDAKDILKFMEFLLKTLYEYPQEAKKLLND